MTTQFVMGLYIGFVVALSTTGILVTQTMISSELVKTGKFFNDGRIYEVLPYGYCGKRHK